MTSASPRQRNRGGGSGSGATRNHEYHDDPHKTNIVPTINGGGMDRDGVMTDVPLRDFDIKKSDSQLGNGNSNNSSRMMTMMMTTMRGSLDEDVRVSRRFALAAMCLFIVLGGAAATGLIVLVKPGCFGNGDVESGNSASSSLRPTTGNTTAISVDEEPALGIPVITPSPTEAPTTMAPTPEPEPLPPAEPGFPETCPNEKIAEVRKQLPAYSCYPPVYPWSQKCGFSHVTKDCQGYLPVREFYANLESTAFNGYSFLGVIVGWNQDDGPVDTLYIGSHNASRYNTEDWNSIIKYTQSCREPISVVNEESPVTAQVMVVEWSDERYRQFRDAKLLSRYNDDELILDRTDPELDPENAISERIDFKFPGENRPIHYMQVDGRNFDHLILTKSISLDTLKRVR
jgi:hypothetical protein